MPSKMKSFSSYLIKSGGSEHPSDRIRNATFEIQPKNPINDDSANLGYVKLEDGYYVINHFTESDSSVSGEIDTEKVGEIIAARIRVQQRSDNWILINEIDFSNFI
jgi:hypothetical protein